MEPLELPMSPSSPSSRSRTRRWLRRFERCCCTALTYFPLPVVYGLTTWAVWVATSIGLLSNRPHWAGMGTSFVGILLYLLLNWSYSVAVFVDPGSPSTPATATYSHLPTHESTATASLMAKSTGDIRYCKKCQARKPDRSHHCSTCKRCVLKMDHHCPWLATCVGLHNYKAFVLFLLYTTLFCWVCFAISGSWVWSELVVDAQYEENVMPINNVLLSVLSGIIGLVLTGFTAWHLSLAWRNQTTIECLENIRYLSPLRRTFQYGNVRHPNGHSRQSPSYGQQLLEIHTNAVPGVTRPEEGEERNSPSTTITDAGYAHPGQPVSEDRAARNFQEYERMRQRDRYEEYLDEKDSEKLPNAFDLGYKHNLLHLFGSNPVCWGLPICNTSGDGWKWDVNPQWVDERDRLHRERAEYRRQQSNQYDWQNDSFETHQTSQQNLAPNGYRQGGYGDSPSRSRSGHRSPYKADQILGRSPGQFVDSPHSPHQGVSLQTLRSRQDPASTDEFDEQYDSTSDEEASLQRIQHDHSKSAGKQR